MGSWKEWVWEKAKDTNKFTIFAIVYSIFSFIVLVVARMAQIDGNAGLRFDEQYWKDVTPFIFINFTLPLALAYARRESTKQRPGKVKDAIDRNHDYYNEVTLQFWDEFRKGVNYENLKERVAVYLMYARDKFESTKTYVYKEKFLFFKRKKKENKKDKTYWQKEKARAFKLHKMMEKNISLDEIKDEFENDDQWDIEAVKVPKYEVLIPEDYYASDSGYKRRSRRFSFGKRILSEVAIWRTFSTLIMLVWTSLTINGWVSFKESGADLLIQTILLSYGCWSILSLVDRVMNFEFLPHIMKNNGFLRKILRDNGWEEKDDEQPRLSEQTSGETEQ